MTAEHLIKLLSELPPETEIAYEVDGDSRRTGDFFLADEVVPIKLRALSYGGYDKDVETDHTYWMGESFDAAIIR